MEKPFMGGCGGCLLSEHSQDTFSDRTRASPHPSLGYLPSPSHHQLGAAPEHPAALPLAAARALL